MMAGIFIKVIFVYNPHEIFVNVGTVFFKGLWKFESFSQEINAIFIIISVYLLVTD